MDYRRFGASLRLLILSTNYLFDRSWVHASESLGWEAAMVPSAMVGGLTREALAKFFATVLEFKPDFVLASNFTGMDTMGLLPHFLEDARIPYVSWFTDTPRPMLCINPVYPSPYAVMATWERAYEPYLRSLGYEHVLFMPLATDPQFFSGTPGDTFKREVAFVGTSMIDEAQDAWASLHTFPTLCIALLEALDAGSLNRASLVDGLDKRLPAAAIDGLERDVLRRAELFVIYEATRRQRRAMLEHLSEFDYEVRGDPAWQSLTGRRGGPLDYFTELAGYYRETAINLNNTSIQMRSAVNQRVFDAPASGGFVLTDAQDDLFEFFDPDAELAIYDSFEELEEKLRYYLAHPGERHAIVQRAQRRIMSEHTHAHRLRSLETFLRERYA